MDRKTDLIYGCGYNLPHEKVEALCKVYKLRFTEYKEEDGVLENCVIFFDKINDQDFEKLIKFDSCYLFDVNVKEFNKIKIDLPDEDFKRLVISTQNAYKIDIAKIYSNFIVEKFKFDANKSFNIRLAIHESIANAILHGNLKIPNNLREDFENIKIFNKAFKENMEKFKNKALTLTLNYNDEAIKLKVLDEGDGYSKNPDDNLPHPKRIDRGLMAIAKLSDNVSIDQNGKEVVISFFILNNVTKPSINQKEHKKSEPKTIVVNKDFSSCSVLVIEDNLQSQTLIGKFLNLISINNVHYSKNGEDGILKALTVNPDLIILNLNLPNMRGDEVLMKIKATPKIRDIPVLIETSYESQDMKDLMFKAGASDYITKPFSLLEFFSRIKINLENRLLIKTLEKELKKIETELRTAKSMQTWLLPNQNDINGLKSKFGFELSHLFLPSLKLSGDFWGVHQVTHKKVAIFSCSFEEYGLTAALNTFRLNTLIKENPIIYPFKPSSYVESLNKVLHTMLPEGNNVKFIYGIIDFETDTFTYASAGFISPLLISDEKITTLGNGGEPLALSLNTRYTDYSVPFKKGTSIFIYSDTLVKSPYICGRVLGVEGLKETLSKYVNKIDKPDTVFNNIVCEFFTNIESVKSLPDDLTMLMISK